MGRIGIAKARLYRCKLARSGETRGRDTGMFETINHRLVMANPERVGREASPSAAEIDSHSVKTTESGGPRGGACHWA